MYRVPNRLKMGSLLIFVSCFFLLTFPCRSAAPDRIFRNSIGMEFVLVPSGTFVMGSPKGEPHRNNDEVEHQVTLTRAYYMQTTEVTRKQWESIMGRSFFSRRYQDELPIVKVSWFDCTEFIKKLNALKEGTYRLPTEAEWEYACLAGGSGPYPWGNSIRCADAMYANNPDKADECVKYVESRGMRPDNPAPDKSYPPNARGLYDMTGNVWEWCSDWYGPYPQNAVSDPTGPETGTVKVRRGGSWFGQGWLCRCANRNFSHPGDRYATLGFRLVKEIP